jgi:hypothetical protein
MNHSQTNEPTMAQERLKPLPRRHDFRSDSANFSIRFSFIFQLLSNSVCFSRLLQACHSWIYSVIFNDAVESEVSFSVVGAWSELLAEDQLIEWRSIFTIPFAIVIHPTIPVGCHQ